jgi:dephospho-CoA kinase
MGRERRDTQVGRTVVAIGLTGGIGAGKSTALAFFDDLGAITLSADRVVHELYERPEVAELVGGHFGAEVLDALGTVDRARLAEAVRGDVDELRWLEETLHPLVREEILSRLQSAPAGSVVVCEVPLLFETGFESLFDLVVTIEAAPKVRKDRSIHQFGLDQFTEFEALQATGERRVAGSDMAFVNDGDLERLQDFVSTVYKRALGLLSADGREVAP